MADVLQSSRHLASLAESSVPFQLRGASVTLLTLRLAAPSHPDFFVRLHDMLAKAPGFYQDAPIVLDLSPLARVTPIDLAAFCVRLGELGLRPVGFQGATAEWEKAAVKAGLSPFPAGRAVESKTVRPRSPTLAKPSATRIVTDPVRSGRQIYAETGDLIVMAPVSNGAELLAEGHIHVYSKLRGRALAGMGGDVTACIFCRAFHAELVSIAGVYQVAEQISPKLFGRPVKIRLDGENLVFDPL
jgi:septum site-determining protein MinC